MAFLIKIKNRFVNVDNASVINHEETELTKDGINLVKISAIFFGADSNNMEFFELLPENDLEALRMLAYINKARS